MSVFRASVVFGTVSAFLAVHASKGLCAGAGGLTVQEVVRAWKARQDDAKTLRFEWTQTETIMPYGLSPDFPARQLVHDVSVAVSIERGMVRHSSRGPRYSPANNECLPQWYLNVFDGVLNKSFFGYAESPDARFFPTGFLGKKEDGNVDRDNADLRAILLTYRPVHRELGGKFDDTGYTILPRRALVDGRECRLLVRSGNLCSSYWVDPKRAFLVLRYTAGRGEKPTYQLDIRYTRDETHGWTPAGWRSMLMHTGSDTMRFQKVAKVVKFEINGTIPPSEFQFAFPPGTRVTDENTGERYIVRDDGARRLITAEEIRGRATYEEMLATDSGQALSARRGRGSGLWLYCVGLVAFMLPLVLALKRLKRART